jgi:hypothetical protein
MSKDTHLMQLVVLCDHLLSQLALEAAQHEGCQQGPHAFDKLRLNLRVSASAHKQVLCETGAAHNNHLAQMHC